MIDNLVGKSHPPSPSHCSINECLFVKGPDPENPGQHVNFSAFAAHLCERRVLSGEPTPAIWALREAFEEKCKEEGESDQLLRDELVLAAAQWILWCGQSLFKQVLYTGEVDPDRLQKSWRPGTLFRGEGGLSVERWHFWRRGFSAVAAGKGGEKEGYGKECMEVAARAAAIMEALEKAMTF